VSSLHPVPGRRAVRRDRRLVASVLDDAVAIGLISPAERDRRLALAAAASTRGELQALVRDLAVPLPEAQRISGVFKLVHRSGRWTVPARLWVLALMGQVDLDFREAEFTSDQTHVWAGSVFGRVRLQVPDGVRVVDAGTSVFGSRQLGHQAPGVRTIQIEGPSIFGEVRTVEAEVDRVVAVVGQARRRGRWRVPAHLEAVSLLGQVELDFREAEFTVPNVRLTANVVLGQLLIQVPERVRVVDQGVAVLGSRNVLAEGAPGGPVLHLGGACVLGEIRVGAAAARI
jgi:hypothetical protein